MMLSVHETVPPEMMVCTVFFSFSCAADCRFVTVMPKLKHHSIIGQARSNFFLENELGLWIFICTSCKFFLCKQLTNVQYLVELIC